MYTKEINIFKELQKDALSADDTFQEKAAMKGEFLVMKLASINFFLNTKRTKKFLVEQLLQ